MSPRPRLRAFHAAVALSVVLAACHGTAPVTSPSAAPSGGTSPTPTATASVTPSPSASPSPTDSPAALADGRSFGYVRSVDLAAGTFRFDLAEFLTGDAAQQAAEEDGAVEPGQPLDNDYYIRNRNPKLRTLTLAANARVRIVNWESCCDSIDGELAPWAAAFEDSQPQGKYHGALSPYWLTIEDGDVVLIEEVYLP